MQEPPQHTPMEIKLLLSQYLDGALEPFQISQVEELLSRFPEYAKVLDQLQATRDAVRTSLGNQEQAWANPPESSSVWTVIASHLQADQQNAPQVFDFEFVSAYYDAEIPSTDEALVLFEGQLYANPQANAMLADVGAVSESVRQWAYRLESSCTVDVTEAVISQLSQETPDIVELPDSALLLSAYLDQALPPREVIVANRLIESDETAKQTLTRFNQISDAIASVTHQLEAQAPDLTASVMACFAQAPSENAPLSPAAPFPIHRLARPKFSQWAQWGGLTAASILLVTFLGSIDWQPNDAASIGPMNAASAPVRQLLQASRKAVGKPLASSAVTELASVPAGSRLSSRMLDTGLATPADSAEFSAVPAVRSVKASSRPVARVLEGIRGPRVAARSFSRPDIAPDDLKPTRVNSPSSEEYLFNALNEQMPGEDVSSILGK